MIILAILDSKHDKKKQMNDFYILLYMYISSLNSRTILRMYMIFLEFLCIIHIFSKFRAKKRVTPDVKLINSNCSKNFEFSYYFHILDLLLYLFSV